MAHYFERKLADLPPAEVAARIEELLKFLNMTTHSHGAIPVNDEIDDAWHLWVMQTKQYSQLCHKLQGGKFIHHSSNEYEEYADKDVKTRPSDLQRGVAMLRSYVVNYGPFEADRVKYWPLAAKVMRQLGWTLDRLNGWLAPPPQRASPRPIAGRHSRRRNESGPLPRRSRRRASRHAVRRAADRATAARGRSRRRPGRGIGVVSRFRGLGAIHAQGTRRRLPGANARAHQGLHAAGRPVLERRVAEGQTVRQGEVLFVVSSDRSSSSTRDAQAAVLGQLTERRESLRREQDKQAEIMACRQPPSSNGFAA